MDPKRKCVRKKLYLTTRNLTKGVKMKEKLRLWGAFLLEGRCNKKTKLF
jgi:hypothetical protein